MKAPRHRLRSFLAASISLPLLAVCFSTACSSEDAPAPATSTRTLSEEYRRLGDNLGQAIALLKSSATAPVTMTAADFGSVAAIPKNLTGGVDLTAEQKGKTGEKASNIDAIGADETVAVLVPDAPTGGGTAATQPSFAAWKGDADSDDDGLCYLAWTKGASWFVASKCGDVSGAWVCQVTSAESVCNACNTAGECAPCDMEQGNFTCAW